MVNTRVRDMAAASPLSGSEKFYADDGASDVYVTGNQLSTFCHEWVNIKDYGAVADGVTDCTAAIDALAADYQGKEVAVLFPPGSYLVTSRLFPTPLFAGISKLTIYGYGAKVFCDSDGATTSNAVCMGSSITGSLNYGDQSAFVADVFPGDTTLTLLDIGDAAKFVVGQWVLLGGLDLQGSGNPPNVHFNEYHQITDITGAVVSFGEAIKDAYLSTWPSWNTPTGSSVNNGGPACIWAKDLQWDTETIIYGVHFTNLHVASNPTVRVDGRKTSFIDCRIEGWPLISAQQEMIFKNCYVGEGMELDKQTEYVEFTNCHLTSGVDCQSSSNRLLVVDGTYCSGIGTVRKTIIRNSHINGLVIGPNFYGRSETLLLENSHIGQVSFNENTSEFVSQFTFTNGQLIQPFSDGPWRMGVPGATIMSMGNNDGSWGPIPFRIGNVTQPGGEGTDTYYDTSLVPDDWPFGTKLLLHPMPHATVINCTGDQEVVDMSSVPGPRPWRSYSKRLYAQAVFHGAATYTEPKTKGFLVEININVIKPFTGTGSPVLTFAFCPYTIYVFGGGWGSGTFAPSVDLTTVGLRKWTPGVTTGSVGSDSLTTLPAYTWFGNVTGVPRTNLDYSGETLDKWPVFTIEIITDHWIASYDWNTIGVSNFG